MDFRFLFANCIGTAFAILTLYYCGFLSTQLLHPELEIRVIDGDTFVWTQSLSFWSSSINERIRLQGIDAPEKKQSFGLESASYLRTMFDKCDKFQLFLSCHFSCDRKPRKDLYGRTIAICYLNGKDIGLSLIEAGLAHPYMTSKSQTKEYKNAYEKAQQTKKGIWNQKHVESPSVYRKEVKEKSRHKNK